MCTRAVRGWRMRREKDRPRGPAEHAADRRQRGGDNGGDQGTTKTKDGSTGEESGKRRGPSKNGATDEGRRPQRGKGHACGGRLTRERAKDDPSKKGSERSARDAESARRT